MPEIDSLPEHVESTVQATAALHADHEASANRSERIADWIAQHLGKPAATAILVGFVIVWIGVNVSLAAFRLDPFDKPPFEWLELLLSFAAALMTVVILASQNRALVLASRRQQLMLQLAFLSDHKQAKIIALLEELRRDDPMIRDRIDDEADAMARTTNLQTVLDALHETREALISTQAKKG